LQALLALAPCPALSHASSGAHAFEEKIADFLGMAVLFLAPARVEGVNLLVALGGAPEA